MTPEEQSIHLVGKLAKLERDLADLREIFPKILDALGNGSGCLPSCSVEFMQWIPDEVRLVVTGLKRELEQERQDRKQAELDVCRALGERNDARAELAALKQAQPSGYNPLPTAAEIDAYIDECLARSDRDWKPLPGDPDVFYPRP